MQDPINISHRYRNYALGLNNKSVTYSYVLTEVIITLGKASFCIVRPKHAL